MQCQRKAVHALMQWAVEICYKEFHRRLRQSVPHNFPTFRSTRVSQTIHPSTHMLSNNTPREDDPSQVSRFILHFLWHQDESSG
jgi:hypothetical protein